MQAIQEYPVPDISPVGATFSPGGALRATTEADHTVQLWDVMRGNLRQRLVGHTHFIWLLTFAADGSLVATGGADQTVRVWDVASQLEIETLRLPSLYAGMKIVCVTGISEAQKVALKMLGGYSGSKKVKKRQKGEPKGEPKKAQ